MSNTLPNPTGIRPIQDNVLIKLISEEKVSPGGLILVKEQREKQQMGVVIAAGPGKHNDRGVFIPTQVKAEDIIYFGVYKGVTITIGHDEYLMMREKDITAVDVCTA